MDIRLPIPKNWQDFETICHKLWSEIWNDQNAEKNGRQGQAQCGVDIYGMPIYTNKYHGVQCKDKDNRLGSVLTSEELVKECGKAKSFKPNLSSYTLATTSQRDVGIQEFYRNLNQKRTFPFKVNVWSWDDIEAEIAYRPSILNHFYSSFKVQDVNASIVKLNRNSTRDHFDAFFSRPKVNETMSKNFKSFLMPVIYELMDNAYQHGKASQYDIKIEKNIIELTDNGNSFDPLSHLDASKVSAKGNIGSYILESFLNKFKGKVEAKFTRTTNNVLQFTADESILNVDEQSHFELTIDLRNNYGRESTKQIVDQIPTDKTELLLNVTEFYNLSVLAEFTKETLSRMTDKQSLTMSVPRHEYLTSFESWFNDQRLKIKIR